MAESSERPRSWRVAMGLILLSGAVNAVLGGVVVASWMIDQITRMLTDVLARWSGW